MFKKIILILSLVILTNCSAPGTAFLGPVFTGAKTGSIYQASISYSTGRLMNELIPSEIFNQKKEQQDPIIISSYKVENISFSDIIEEEPLP